MSDEGVRYMAKNTGRGSRAAAQSPTAGLFQEVKAHGGSFQPWPTRSRWWRLKRILAFYR